MAALAEELGLDRDFALKEMADRVLPDSGARKAYPVAQTRQAPGPQAVPLCSHAPVITAGPRPPADIQAAAGSRAGRRMGLAARLTGWIAGWREVGHRRRVASRIYRDLVAERIGIDRAVRELQSLKDRRQHG
jgi:hypothetical protein